MRFHHSHHSAILCLSLGLAACGGGGEVPGGGGRGSGNTVRMSDIEVVNTTSAEGVGVAEVVVPLQGGQMTDVPYIVTADKLPCQVFAMGPRFADGSIRYLRLEVPVAVTPGERRTLELRTAEDAPPRFARHPSIPGTIGIQAQLRAGKGTQTFPEPTLIEEGPIAEVYRSRVRGTGTMIWGELTVTIYSQLPYAKFTLQWGNSQPDVEGLYEDPGVVELLVRGASVEHEHGFKILGERVEGEYQVATLHRGGQISDGQSQIIEGRLVFSGTTPPRVFALAKNWVAAGTYGPLGQLLPEIPVNVADFEDLIERDEHAQVDHPWGRPVHGCNPDPSNTGAQPDFGTIKMRADVLLADPRRLPTILRSIYQETCRATHHRERDVSRVKVANHPGLLTLDGRPKLAETTDFLGKKHTWLTTTMKGPSGDRWLGHDVEHLSINYLAGIALLTGNRFARQEVDHHVMLYLTGFTHKTGSYNDSPGPARKVGRSSLAAIWMWLVTGREDVRQRVTDRADDVRDQLDGQKLNIAVVAPRGSYWVPWEEGMASTGLFAVYQNFQTASVLDVLDRTTPSLALNGFGKLQDGWHCGYELPWRFSNGKTYYASEDPDFGNIAAGNGLTTWSIPALFIAAEFHQNEFVRDRALQIIRERYGRSIWGLSEDLEWICVSPNATTLANLTGQ